MLEIEVKCPVDDIGHVEERLISQGGVFLGGVSQEDRYLGHPCRDFASTDEGLRLRRERDRVALYYKGPKLDKLTKTREELSTPVPDPGSMDLILQRLGFTPVATVEKVRRSYRLGNVEVSLDRVSGLGEFVELEVQDLPLDIGRSLLEEARKALGLERTERRSYLELLLEKRTRSDVHDLLG